MNHRIGKLKIIFDICTIVILHIWMDIIKLSMLIVLEIDSQVTLISNEIFEFVIEKSIIE